MQKITKPVLLSALALVLLSAGVAWILQARSAGEAASAEPQRVQRQDRDRHDRFRKERDPENPDQMRRAQEGQPITAQSFGAAVSRAEQWPDKGLLFTKTLAGDSVPLEVLWEVFQSLEDDSAGAFGRASVATTLFRGLAARNPGYGIECLDTLPPGHVRTSALLAFASALPASHVAELHEVLLAAGFKEDLRVFNEAVSVAPHGVDELRYLVNLGIFDAKAQETLEKRLRRYEAEIGLESGGTGGDAAVEEPDSPSAGNPALHRFYRRYSEDRLGAAREVQAGAFPEISDDRQRVRDLAKGLAAASAPAALEWALAWKTKSTRLASVSAVIETWAELDPMGCSQQIGRIGDEQARDVAAGQLAIYLARMGSREEAEAWLESIQSKQVRSDAETVIAE